MLTIQTLKILQEIVHYGLHILFPMLVAYVFFKSNWRKAYLLMLLTMLVDLDHLLATPIFDANRMSIGFHPLHSYGAIVFYVILLFIPKTRIFAIGLLLHMLTDFQDGLWVKIISI